MSNAKRKFKNIWVNQTTLGNQFNLSAVAIGRQLVEIGLRDGGGQPTQRALDEGYCISTPMADGRPFYRWHGRKAGALLKEYLTPLSPIEQRMRKVAREIIILEKSEDDHMAAMAFDELVADLSAEERIIVNRFLQAGESKLVLD